jgi:hypothetical protein
MQRQWIRENYANYPDEFFSWLKHNYHIWKEFESKALMMSYRRKRYSARTIIEVMRWDTDIREKNPLFKISNNMVPGLARLWMVKYGAKHPKFFNLQNK